MSPSPSLNGIEFVIEGAGVHSANGIYHAVGFFNGALLFRHEDEQEGVVHFLSCTVPRKTISKSSLWALVSSTNFPDPDHDILFYTCSSTFMQGALPSRTGWEACPRQSAGLTELLLPVPQVCGLLRSQGCIDLLAHGMVYAEIQEDDRVGMLVEHLAAKTEESTMCSAWMHTGTCAHRFRTCHFRHASSARYRPLPTKCAAFLSAQGCIKSAYECDKLHAWGDRKLKLRSTLLKHVPTLLVQDAHNRAALLF